MPTLAISERSRKEDGRLADADVDRVAAQSQGSKGAIRESVELTRPELASTYESSSFTISSQVKKKERKRERENKMADVS